MTRVLRRFFLPLLLAAGLFGIAGPAAAQDSPVLDRVIKSGELRVGMSGNQPPLNVRSRSGSLIGLEVDLANLIASGIRADLKIVQKPFGELLEDLKAGQLDMVMSGMAITARRTQSFSFVGPYMLSGKSILTKSSVLGTVDSAGALNDADLRLAALENSTSQDFIEKVMPKSKLVKVKDYDDAVQMLLDDKIDALVADMPACMLAILRHPDAGLTTLKEPFTFEPIGIAVPANDPQFQNLIDNYVDTAERVGALELMRQKWLEDSAWIAALP